MGGGWTQDRARGRVVSRFPFSFPPLPFFEIWTDTCYLTFPKRLTSFETEKLGRMSASQSRLLSLHCRPPSLTYDTRNLFLQSTMPMTNWRNLLASCAMQCRLICLPVSSSSSWHSPPTLPSLPSLPSSLSYKQRRRLDPHASLASSSGIRASVIKKHHVSLSQTLPLPYACIDPLVAALRRDLASVKR